MANSIFSFFSKTPKNTTPEPPIKVMTPEMFMFLKQLPSAVLLLDVTGKIKFANDSAAALLKSTVEKLEGSAVSKWGISLQQVHELTDDKQGTKTVIVDRSRKKQKPLQVTGRVLADTPFILLNLLEVPAFEQLSADKKFLTEVFNNYPAATVVQDGNGNCVLCNGLAARLFNVSSQDVQTKPLGEWLPGELVTLLAPLDQQVYQGKDCTKQIVSYQTASNEEKVFVVSKTLVGRKEEPEHYIISIFEDITQHYQSDQQLQRSYTLLQAILNNVPLGLYTRDCDGKMTYFNKQSMSVFNEKDANLTDKPHAFQDQENVKFHRSREAQILKEGKPFESPAETYIDSSGATKILHLIKVPLTDAGPKPLVLSIVQDITVRHQQEQDIKRINRFLSAILQNAPIGLYARQGNGQMLFRNKQCNTIFGDVEERDYDNCGKLPHETSQQASEYLDREKEILLSGKILDIPEEEYITASGERKLLHLVKVPVVGPTPEESFIVTLVEDITLRQQQERDLLETKNTLQSILEHVPVAIYARSIDDKISFINKQAQALFPGESEYKSGDDFYGKREKAIFENGKILEFPEEWYTTKSGDKMLLHLIKAPVFDKEGKPFMVLNVAEDITHKKEQEQAIVDAKNFLQAVINQLPVSLSVKNYDGKYILWNKKSEELFGVRAEDVIGQTAYRRDLNKDQMEFLREADLRVFESKKEQTIPQELISSSEGGVKIMHTVKTPVFNPDGTPNCLLVVSEDITLKTKMEKQIREASDKNTLLIDNAREGIIIMEDGKIMYANRAFCNMLGFEDLNAVQGKKLLDLAIEDHQVLLKARYEEVLAGLPQASQPIEVRFEKVSGGKIEAEFSAVSSKYLGRRIVLGFVRDITQANRNLRSAKTERDHLRAIFESGINPIFILNPKGYITDMNEACRKLFGFTKADKNFYRNVYIRPAISLPVRRKLQEGQSAQMEYTFDFDRAARLFPGRIEGKGKLPLTVAFVPLGKSESKEGATGTDYAVFLDKKKQIIPPAPKKQEPLPPAKSVSVVERLVLPNSEPYVLCDSNFAIETCNELFCSLCQLQEDELAGQDLIRLFPADSHVVLMQDLQTLRQEGKISNREYSLLVGSSLEVCQVRVSAIKDQEGRYLFVFRSLTFQRQIMNILEERSAHLTALLSATGGLVFSVRFEHGCFGRIEPGNGALAAKMGYTPEELAEIPFSKLFFDPARDDRDPSSVLKQAQKAVKRTGKASFRLGMCPKGAPDFEAQITVTSLDLPGKETALVVVHDLTEQLDEVARESQQALELRTMRHTLPGLYLKLQESGEVVDVNSNLDYLSSEEASDLFLHKTPEAFWPQEIAHQIIFSLKEALAMRMDTKVEIPWEVAGKVRYFSGIITPIHGCDEAVLWLTDASGEQIYSQHLQELYRVIRQPARDITEQVERLLALGKSIFNADVGMVLRFRQGKKGCESMVMYTTPNTCNLQRRMDFAVEECLAGVAEGTPALLPDLGNLSCHHCIHTEKNFGSLLAAPLEVRGKVVGALCFAATDSRRSFETGTEEILGVLARLLGMRLELRTQGHQLEDNARALVKTVEYCATPAAAIDKDFQIISVNESLLTRTKRKTSSLLGCNFFEELTRSGEVSKRIFQTAQKTESEGEFTLKLDVLNEKGLYTQMTWTVFLCQNAQGELDGYILLAN